MLHKSTVRAKDIMMKTVRTVNADDSIFDATQMLCKNGFSGAPVVDADNRIMGMLSEKDCIHAFLNAIHHREPPARVSEVMTREVITVTEETGVLDVAHLFVHKGLRRVPVVQGELLVGQISRRDLLKKIVTIFEGSKDHEAAILYLSALERSAPV
jgi:predicted transcriptional regulator